MGKDTQEAVLGRFQKELAESVSKTGDLFRCSIAADWLMRTWVPRRWRFGITTVSINPLNWTALVESSPGRESWTRVLGWLENLIQSRRDG
jgi:hypothetical protein